MHKKLLTNYGYKNVANIKTKNITKDEGLYEIK